jgi:hypothetical protein
VVHSCGKVEREEEKKCHWVAGSRKGEQVSRWVKYLILQVVQWFRGGEEF